MTTIELPDGNTEESQRFWGLRPPVAEAAAAYSAVLSATSQLSVGESEAARMTIAFVNECVICRTARPAGADTLGLTETWYADLSDPTRRDAYTPREALAIEFAQKFCAGKAAFDDDHWTRLQEAYAAAEIVDLAALCGKSLGQGRVSAVFDLQTSCALTVPVRSGAAASRTLEPADAT